MHTKFELGCSKCDVNFIIISAESGHWKLVIPYATKMELAADHGFTKDLIEFYE